MNELPTQQYDPSNLDAPRMNVIDLVGATKKYGAKLALDSVTYSVEPGSVFALLGENGAGKTTTIKLLLGETAPTSGQVRLFQRDPWREGASLRSRIGYVPEFPVLYAYMTVAEIGKFAAAFYPQNFGPEYAKRCQEFELAPNDKISALSKGMKAKVSLALALAHNPELLVLDEPTSGLDALVRRQFLANIADLAASGKTVFLSSHQTTEVERVADQVAFMKNGRVVLVERLAPLMDSARIVTATVTGQIDETNPLATLFKTLFSETISVERYGARYRILGRGLVDGYEERLRVVLKERLAETSIVRPTLEDIFVGYMTRKE